MFELQKEQQHLDKKKTDEKFVRSEGEAIRSKRSLKTSNESLDSHCVKFLRKQPTYSLYQDLGSVTLVWELLKQSSKLLCIICSIWKIREHEGEGIHKVYTHLLPRMT